MQSSSPVALWNEHILPLRKELKNSIQTKKNINWIIRSHNPCSTDPNTTGYSLTLFFVPSLHPYFGFV